MNAPAASPTPPPPQKRWTNTFWLILVVLLLGTGLFFYYIKTGGLIARQRPSALETFVAQGIVNLSVPADAKALKNPLAGSSAAAAAGRELYQKNCEICHGYDGSGKTVAGSGAYPPPLSLSPASLAQRHRTDGELFYFIRNGIRNTAMPGWQLPDPQLWQLVAYLRKLPLTSSSPTLAENSAPPASVSGAHYLGSVSCKSCHSEIYEHWKKTPMANVVRDPREHPEAITPDLSKADPLVKFTKDEIALVYGSIWKQRYYKKVGDDYFLYPAQWDITHQTWKPYFVKDDWWVAFYPPDNFQRPTGPLCDGCHSVNYNTKTKQVTEWNVGCERCHGPGSEHVKQALASNIINPARLDYVAGNDTCIQCHSQGRPTSNPIDGKYYDWPVGYEVSGKLQDHWKLEEHKLGETTFTHFADGTAHKNRMQGNDYVTSLMYNHGVTCFTCHDAHGTEYPSNLRKPARDLCMDCHAPGSPNGPHASSIAEHTHHQPDGAGSDCIACHMPKIATTIGDVMVRSHTFHFVNPATTDSSKVPNACNACHKDKTTSWSMDALRNWPNQSHWRTAQ